MEKIFIILFGLSMLYMSSTGRIQAHIKILAIQGFLLFVLSYFSFGKFNMFQFLFVILETLIVKMIILPIFLMRILHVNKIYRDTEAYVSNFYYFVFASTIFFLSLLFTDIHHIQLKSINSVYFGVSMSVIIISLFLITFRHKVISNVIGFISMENGIFLLSLSVAKEMPLIVNLGALLDIFITVFILGLLVNKISESFENLNVSALSSLKDCEYYD